jgi:hypothetical protein
MAETPDELCFNSLNSPESKAYHSTPKVEMSGDGTGWRPHSIFRRDRWG